MPALLGRRGRLIAAVAVAVFAGCSSGGDDLPREAVSGTVTLDGKPLESGMISFQPAGQPTEQGRPQTQADATITDGKYAIPDDQGLVPGRYTVRISGLDAPAEQAPADAIPGESYPKTPKDPVPKRYNVASTLTAEVTSDGPNTFDFSLESK